MTLSETRYSSEYALHDGVHIHSIIHEPARESGFGARATYLVQLTATHGRSTRRIGQIQPLYVNIVAWGERVAWHACGSVPPGASTEGYFRRDKSETPAQIMERAFLAAMQNAATKNPALVKPARIPPPAVKAWSTGFGVTMGHYSEVRSGSDGLLKSNDEVDHSVYEAVVPLRAADGTLCRRMSAIVVRRKRTAWGMVLVMDSGEPPLFERYFELKPECKEVYLFVPDQAVRSALDHATACPGADAVLPQGVLLARPVAARTSCASLVAEVCAHLPEMA